MNLVIAAIRLAGIIQLIIAAANFVVAYRLDYRSNLRHMTPIVGQIFIVHAAYIVGVLSWFGLLCLVFAPELASGEPIMRFVSGGLAVFWGARVIVHLTVYDRAVRRRYRIEDQAFLLACISLTAIFAWAVIQ